MHAKQRFYLFAGLCLAISLGLVLAGAAYAQSGEYQLPWFTVDSGGGASSGASSGASGGAGYHLLGTAGQPDSGVLSGEGYSLHGGFWPAGQQAAPPENTIFIPLLKR